MTGNLERSTHKQIAPGQGTRRTDAAARAMQALDMRLAGASYDEIARQLGYADRSGAWRAVEGELRELRHEKAREVISLELARLDLLMASAWTDALAGDRHALAAVLRIMERRARYLGLDNPSELPLNVDELLSRSLGY